jgi:hypothetical protein
VIVVVPHSGAIMVVAVFGAASMACTNSHGASDSTPSTPGHVIVATPITSLVAPVISAFSAAPTSSTTTINNQSPPVSNYVWKSEPEPEDLKPHHLKIELPIQGSSVMGIYGNDPHVSDDGSTVIVLVDSQVEVVPQTLLIRPLDGKTPNREIPLLNTDCERKSSNWWCEPRPKAEKQIAIANRFLAKHRWVKFQAYAPSHPSRMETGCGKEVRSRHFRIPGFDVTFETDDPTKDAHLRIARDDGAVITDSAIDVHAPNESKECRRGTMPYLNDIGFDTTRRAMYVTLDACGMEGCPSGLQFLFFRLPPPVPKAAGDATRAPKR